MMTATITLQLDEKLMDSVQNYAIQQGQSLSELIENYLKNLASQSVKKRATKPFPLSTIEQGFGCTNYQGKVISLEEMEQGITEELQRQWINQ
jgi:hypothetical protein